MAKLEENRRVCWLPGSATDSTRGAPLPKKFRVARLADEATPDSETKATQLESEETRRPKHKTTPRRVNRNKHDARQIVHLQSRSRSRETVDHAHRPQVSTHEGEDRKGKDAFFSNATLLQCSESGAAFLNMSENGAEARLVGACGAYRQTDRIRPIK